MHDGRRLEAIDTRTVFRAYATLACLFGLGLLSWGPMWIGGGPGGAALVRVFGSVAIAGACCAAGFATVDDPAARRRGLFWFAVGHTVICLVVGAMLIAVRGPGPAETAAQLLLVVVFVLFYLWATSEGEYSRGATLISLFSGVTPGATERVRSQYEQQIRQAAGQEERNRLARDLHDSIKQQIFVIQTAAATAQARFDSDSPGAREALEQVRSSAREAMTEMEVMMDQLRALPLENTGLIETLKKQCEALGCRTGARVEFKLGKLPPSEALAPGSQQAISRVAQEALANVGRHARARNVFVSLDSLPGRMELRIQDDGAGFDPNQSRRGMGIANMRARADEFGGEFELVSGPGSGTSVRFSIPSTSNETPQEYKQRAVGLAVMLVISILVSVWTRQINMVIISTVTAVGVLRYAVAYRRARKQSQDAR